MTEDKPTGSENPAPVRRRRIISDASGNTPAGDGGPEKSKNRTRTLPGVTAPSSREATTRRKRKSTRSNETERSPQPQSGQEGPKRAPQVGDSRPASPANNNSASAQGENAQKSERKRRRRTTRGKGKSVEPRSTAGPGKPVEAIIDDKPINLNEEQLERRRGRERKGRPVGRYQMLVHVHEGVTHIAVLEGRSLIEHYVSHPADDVSEIHGNIYLGKVQNVLPGMEAAFVDIGTPKNAVLYRGDVTYDSEDVEASNRQQRQQKTRTPKSRFGRSQSEARIEDLLTAQQSILCQVTKNPIAHKGARLSTEISLPGRFVVLVPNSDTYGISKRLGDRERRRLRNILDKVKPAEHGVIVRTAAQDVTAEEIERDVRRLLDQWQQINELSSSTKAPSLLFREPELAVRVIREEFNRDYRGVVIDDPKIGRAHV